jgi:cyanophycin synthetase
MTLLYRYASIQKFRRKFLRRLVQFFRNSSNRAGRDRAVFYSRIWREAAAECGLTAYTISDKVMEFRYRDAFVTRIYGDITMLDNPATLMIAGDKALTYELLEKARLPITEFRAFRLDSLVHAKEFIRDREGPFVIKPVRGTATGLGVSTNLTTFAQCVNAAALAATYCDDLLIEKHVAGESYRLLFVGQKLARIARRSGARVTGDGVQTLAQLIRRTYPSLSDDVDKMDDGASDLAQTCSAQGYQSADILGKGLVALVTSRPLNENVNVELRTVYTEDVTDAVCDEIIEDARRACAVLHSEFTGIDVITTNPRVSLLDSKGVIVEVNTTPGLQHHYELKGNQHEESAAAHVLRYIISKQPENGGIESKVG